MKNFCACCLVLLICSLYGCGNEKSEKLSEKNVLPKNLSMSLEGYTLPGTVETAKSNGFTDCDKTYKCKKNVEVNLFGVPVEHAFIDFKEAGNETYDKITFTIPRIKLNKQCALKAKGYLENQKCILPSDLDKFKKRLLDLNWKKDPVIHSRYTAYYNSDVRIKIELNNHDQDNIALMVVTATEFSEKLNDIKKYETEEASKSNKADAFIETMKKP